MKSMQTIKQTSNLPQQQKQGFAVMMQTDGFKNLINNTLGDPKRATRFIANITSAVAINPALQECDPSTILSAALVGESLNLSPSPSLGQMYLVPYRDNKNNRVVAQFQLGYKGFIQLAIRSGYYKKLNVIAIKEGELVSYDPLNEEIEVQLIEDDDVRENTPTIGYYAMFEYVGSGFRKTIYWSKEKMLNHADKYSAAFSKSAYEKWIKGEVPPEERWKYSSFWFSDFDGMAYKTMLRQLISKWGVMSTELQMAYENDQGVPIVQNGRMTGVEYVDNKTVVGAQFQEQEQQTEQEHEKPQKAKQQKAKKEVFVESEVVEDDDPLA